MADTRSNKQKKGTEQRVEEELVPLAIGEPAPLGMESLVRYLLEKNEASEKVRRREAEDAEARAEERLERREAKRLLAEKEAREELRKQQIEDEKRMFGYQQEIMRLQANLGEKADTARREEADRCRKRDKAVAGIQSYRESDDVEEYMVSAEKKLMVSGIPEEEWGAVIAAKLSGRVGAAWEDLQVEGADYGSMKTGLLSICGYTPKIAGDLFFGFRQESIKGMTADHLWRRGVQLLRRMVAPGKLEASFEFSIVKAWIWAVVPKGTRLFLDSRVVKDRSDLILALQDHLVIEGEKGEGQVAVFGEQHRGPEQSSEERRPVGSCFECGKPGHKMADCWQRSGSGESAKPSAGGSAKPIICFSCGVEGHRSPQCPKKGQQEEPRPKEEPKPKEGLGQARPVPVRRVRLVSPGGRRRKDTVLDGIVNGRETVIVLDTGTAISVVPEEWVEKELETGEEVPIVVFGSEGPVFLPVAKVQFKVQHLEWEEEVALAPTIEGQETEVLYRWNLCSDIGDALTSLVLEEEKEQRAEAQKQAEEEKDEAVGADKGVMAADRPVKTPESVPPAFEDFEFETDEEEEEENSFAAEDIFEEEDLRASLAEEKDDDVELLAEVEEETVELLAEEKEEEHTLAEGDFVVRKFGQNFAKRTSVLSPWTAKLSPSVVEWTEEGLQVFRDKLVSLGYFCFCCILMYLDLGWSIFWKSTEGDPWRPAAILQREEQGETDELRAAPNSQLVGGDVGSRPTEDKKQKEPRRDWDDIR